MLETCTGIEIRVLARSQKNEAEALIKSTFNLQCPISFRNKLYLAAYDGLKIVGIAGISRHWMINLGGNTIENVAVHAAYRRQGIGLRLIEGLIHERGLQDLFLLVDCTNQPAITLYRNLGFNETGKLLDFGRANLLQPMVRVGNAFR